MLTNLTTHLERRCQSLHFQQTKSVDVQLRRRWPPGWRAGDVPPTGRTLRLPICLVLETAAGRIASNHVYYDQMTFAAQLGLMPEPMPAT